MGDINTVFSKGKDDLQPVILIHGDLQNHTSLNFLSDLIKSKGHTVLSFDLPGHGLSNFSEDNTNHIATLKKIIEQNQIKNPIIIGHSIGSAIASIYAEENTTSSLILINPLISNIKTINPSIDPEKMTEEYTQYSKALFKEQRLSNFSEQKSPKDFTKLGFETTSPQGLKNNMKFIKDLPEQDNIQNIEVPILIIASEDDPSLPIQYSEKLHKKAKSSKLEIIQGGHNTVLTNHKGITDAINKHYDFLLGQ